MDNVLKQRLVGATILIALAVIFLPMLFEDDGIDPGPRQLAVDLPQRAEGERREMRRLALDPERARVPDSSPEQTGSADPAPVVVDPPEIPSVRTEEQPEANSPDMVAESAPPAGPGPASEGSRDKPEVSDSSADRQIRTEVSQSDAIGGWMVQVAVFGSAETASIVRSRLEDLGHSVVTDTLVRDQSELYRLRTGPYQSESLAGRARDQIAATVAGVEPVVREFDTVTAEATSDPADPPHAATGAGFAVQVGSFASRNNADRLVAQLREQNHDAFMHGEESGGRMIWRVRVGNFNNRERADALLEELRSEAGLEGIVVSHP